MKNLNNRFNKGTGYNKAANVNGHFNHESSIKYTDNSMMVDLSHVNTKKLRKIYFTRDASFQYPANIVPVMITHVEVVVNYFQGMVCLNKAIRRFGESVNVFVFEDRD